MNNKKNTLSSSKNISSHLREQIRHSITENKISEMLNKIDNPIEYINAITKLLPYAIGKIKATETESIEDNEKIVICLNLNEEKL